MSLRAAVIGGGPAGLMAAEALAKAGLSVTVYEAMPSLGRKFLMAGKSGLNLTKDEPDTEFGTQFFEANTALAPMLSAFGPREVMAWAQGLGQPLFTGSTGRVFPKAMKASPLLRAWAAALGQAGVVLRPRHRWQGWDGPMLCFETPNGPLQVSADVTVFALGGASWARLGSDGAWAPTFANEGVPMTEFQPSNVGVAVEWSAILRRRAGSPLKNIRLCAGALSSRGEVVITPTGLEGGGIYPLTPALREGAALAIDFCPDLSVAALATKLAKTKDKTSISNTLRKATGQSPAAKSLMLEFVPPPRDPLEMARHLKAKPIPITGLGPLDEAISTAGGIAWAGVNKNLMVKARPGVFVAGEMLDWEAPTGGYLITACLATGRWAGRGAAAYAQDQAAGSASGQ